MMSDGVTFKEIRVKIRQMIQKLKRRYNCTHSTAAQWRHTTGILCLTVVCHEQQKQMQTFQRTTHIWAYVVVRQFWCACVLMSVCSYVPDTLLNTVLTGIHLKSTENRRHVLCVLQNSELYSNSNKSSVLLATRWSQDTLAAWDP
jgi:uncharacterized protein YlxP (DUF503 family)